MRVQGALAAALAAATIAGSPASAAAQVLAEWVRFRAAFDGGTVATLAHGNPNTVGVRGGVRFEPGRSGKALVVGAAGGGAEIAYETIGNLDLTRPGGLSIWVANRTWRDAASPAESEYAPFFRVAGASSAAFLLERDHRVRDARGERFIGGLFQLPRARQIAQHLFAAERWRPGDWHLVVATWDRTGFAVSLDGGPLVRRAVPGDVLAATFPPAAGRRLYIGSTGAETFLVDDLAIYARALGAADVDALLRGAP